MNEEKKEDIVTDGEGGISIRDIFRIIGKKIWYVLAATLAVTLAAVLVFMFAINPSKQYNSMSFQIDYPMCDEGKYPDGSMFNYRDIVSREVIETAKNDERYKDEFASIDVDKVMKEAISISAYQPSNESDAPYIYTVSLKSTCFNGVSTENFLTALTDAFIKVVIEGKANELDYELDPNVFESASYKDQLLLLTEQKDVLVKQYEDWIKEYSTGRRVLGKSLGTYRTEIKTMLADKEKDPIESDLTMKGYEYFNGSVTEKEIRERVTQLQAELKFDRAILEEIGNYNAGVSGHANMSTGYANSGIMPFAADDSSENTDSSGNTTVIVGGNSELMYYIKRAQTVQQQITYLTSKCPQLQDGVDPTDEKTDVSDWTFTEMVSDIQKFGKTLLEQFNILNGNARTLTNVISDIYNKDTVVIFNSQSASSEGGTSLVIVAVGVLVVSFLVFAVIAFFVGKKSLKPKTGAPKEKTEKEETEKAE